MAPILANPLARTREAAFERHYRKHVRDVYGFAYGVLGNRPDAEDITQTTFLNAYRAYMRGDSIENMRAWLLAIAQNVCRQRFRTSSRRPKEVELDPDVADTFVDEDAPSAGEIRAAMEELAFNQRVVLVLREIEGLSYEEIAETMGITLSAVETLLFRARRALREQLEATDKPLSCDSVERLISLQLDGKLARHEKGLLRAHLRTCPDCARLARSQRARKRAMPGLGWAPLPAGLADWSWSPVSSGVGAKLATVAVGAAIVAGGALVTTGVLPAPAGQARDGAIRALDERATEIGEFAALDAASAAAAQTARAERSARAGKDAADATVVKATKQGKLRLAARANRGRTGGVTTPPGDGGSTGVSVPTVSSVGSAVSSVGSAVSQAGSKVSDGVASGVVEPSSLPPVTIPDTDGSGPLP